MSTKCSYKPPWPPPIPWAPLLSYQVPKHSIESYQDYSYCKHDAELLADVMPSSSEKFSQDLNLEHIKEPRIARPIKASQPLIAKPAQAHPNLVQENHSNLKHSLRVRTKKHKLILLQNTLCNSKTNPFFQALPNPPVATITTRPSHKAPSLLLSATKASSARTRSSSRLAQAKVTKESIGGKNITSLDDAGGEAPVSASGTTTTPPGMTATVNTYVELDNSADTIQKIWY